MFGDSKKKRRGRMYKKLNHKTQKVESVTTKKFGKSKGQKLKQNNSSWAVSIGLLI